MSSRPVGNLLSFIRNSFTSRAEWVRKYFDTRRDIDEECGYPHDILMAEYSKLFERGDIAGRVVSLFPEESWSDPPDVFETEDQTETEFEKGWDLVNEKFRLASIMQRADVLSGVGRYGVLLLGIDDGKKLSDPVDGVNDDGTFTPPKSGERKLIYIRPFEEKLATVQKLEQNIQNPRYGMPLQYSLHFVDTTVGAAGDQATSKSDTTAMDVHWSRVIHIADNRTNSDIYGTPRMKRVFNRLLDIRKIVGGSGEMFWKGGFPGLSFESVTLPGGEIPLIDEVKTKEQVEKYMNGLQRYLALVGMTAKSLAPQIADPESHVNIQLKLLCAAIGVPWRVFIGSEAAQLASDQDTKRWNRRITRRREDYLTPYVVRPLVDRLVGFGVLPPPGEEGYTVHWPDVGAPGDAEKAEIAERRSNAMSKYVQSGVDSLVPPFHYLTLVLDFTDEEANSIIEAAEERMEDEDQRQEEIEEAAAQMAGTVPGNGQPRRGTVPARATPEE